jgi:phenylalanyl-tRNA synthetase beta chain
MKISSQWVREFIDPGADDRRLAQDLTLHGINVEGIEFGQSGAIFDVEFTTNRPDAMNHYGVARECSAIYDLDLKPLEGGWPEGPEAAKQQPLAGHSFPVTIEDSEGCARYTAQVMRGVTMGESPENIVRHLQAVEQRPINNAADASNYVLWEMGHPTHAFDLDRLEGGRILVRRARDGEVLKTLDGVERTLSKRDLVIADAERPVALAGVMGGEGTMITPQTRNILIESAWFDPVSVRQTARRHGLHTDASHRFERGADFEATRYACARVAELILLSAGGKLEGAAIDVVGRTMARREILLRGAEIERVLGEPIAAEEIERILRRLGLSATRTSGLSASPTGARPERSEGPAAPAASIVWAVCPPSFRLDLEQEIDLIEEVARIHGYENFPNTLPCAAGVVVELPDERKDARVRRTMLALGYNEAMSLTFIAEEDARTFSAARPLLLENPVSAEAPAMRSSLLPGMLQMMAWNLNRGNRDVRLFECGHVFGATERRGAEERKQLCLGATGNAPGSNWDRSARPYTFFDMKGDVEELLRTFAHRNLYFDEHVPGHFHPGRAARAVMDGLTVAEFGLLHPGLAAARKLRQDVYVGAIHLERLYQHALREPHYRALPRFHAVFRDFSFLFANDVSFARMAEAAHSLRIAELQSFLPAEVLRGGTVPAGKFSILLRAAFQSAERTLTDEEVTVWSGRIIDALQRLGGVLRT